MCIVATEQHLIVLGGSQGFDNDYVRNVIIFGINNTSLSHADNQKNNFLILGEGPSFEINGKFGSPEKKFRINITKANSKLCLDLHYSADYSYLFVSGKEIFEFKVDKKKC